MFQHDQREIGYSDSCNWHMHDSKEDKGDCTKYNISVCFNGDFHRAEIALPKKLSWVEKLRLAKSVHIVSGIGETESEAIDNLISKLKTAA